MKERVNGEISDTMLNITLSPSTKALGNLVL